RSMSRPLWDPAGRLPAAPGPISSRFPVVGRGSASFLALTAVAVTAVVAASAQASPSADYSAVKSDWRKDGKITPCRFSLPELQHASELAAANNEDGYTTLPDEIDREIGRWNSGDCRKVAIARLRLSVSPRTV